MNNPNLEKKKGLAILLGNALLFASLLGFSYMAVGYSGFWTTLFTILNLVGIVFIMLGTDD